MLYFLQLGPTPGFLPHSNNVIRTLKSQSFLTGATSWGTKLSTYKSFGGCCTHTLREVNGFTRMYSPYKGSHDMQKCKRILIRGELLLGGPRQMCLCAFHLSGLEKLVLGMGPPFPIFPCVATWMTSLQVDIKPWLSPCLRHASFPVCSCDLPDGTWLSLVPQEVGKNPEAAKKTLGLCSSDLGQPAYLWLPQR